MEKPTPITKEYVDYLNSLPSEILAEKTKDLTEQDKVEVKAHLKAFEDACRAKKFHVVGNYAIAVGFFPYKNSVAVFNKVEDGLHLELRFKGFGIIILPLGPE